MLKVKLANGATMLRAGPAAFRLTVVAAGKLRTVLARRASTVGELNMLPPS